MKLLRKIIVASITLFTASASAGTVWLSKDNISEFYPHSSGTFIVMAAAKSKYSQCNNGKRYNLDKRNKNYETINKALAMAFALEKPVKLVIATEHTCAPRIDRVVVLRK